ncbi:uncharacterized protein [Asterias amurensis]|uniref:uncharacterized protein isoform X4 n=1 Tax=Asterias amurensis TaxID=7602 RepID=UPI003AB35C64
MHSSKTGNAQRNEKATLKCSLDMALSERPLTIGCCQPPKTVSPHLELRDSANNPTPHPPSMTDEINYEGQGASPGRPKPRRLSSAWSDSSPLKPEQNYTYTLIPERGQRKRSGHSSGGSTDEGALSIIDKEDLLDTIFISCDTEGCGRVPVSRVIQHIQMIVNSNETNNIDELALQLDPSGLDIEIDLATYQNGIARWIKNVQNQRHLEMSAIMEDRMLSSPGGDIAPHWKAKSLDLDISRSFRAMSTPLSSTTRSHWKTRKSDTSRLLSGLLDASLDLSACSYGSLEAQGGDSPPDMSELQNQIEDLQFQIRKLSEHNGKLQTQIETSDDTNDQLMCQIEGLKGELKSLQQAWQRSQSIRDENEELKSSNKEWLKKYTIMQREKRCLDDKLVSLQLEASKKQELETKLQEIQEQLSINIADAETLQEDHRRLQTSLQKKKHQCEETEAHLQVKNAELSEKAKRCEEMQANLEELYNLNRVMKAEKTKLEGRLSEVCQELDSYRTQQFITPQEVNSMSPSLSPRSESGLGRSLHSELKSVVSADENLPSPICGNEDFDFESHIDSASSSTANTPDTPSSSWQQPSSANQLLVHFRRRKDDVMRQLQSFLVEEDQNNDNGEEGSSSKQDNFTKLLETELDSMMDKITSLTKSRKNFEHRANKLSFMLRSLQDDYVRISKKYEEAIKHCKELTSTKCELERVKAESEILQFSIQTGKQKTQELERNLSSCELDLESAHQANQKYRQMVETQLGELRRLFKEMEKKYKISQDNARKQEAAYKSKTAQQESKHSSHVKAILDLVQSSCSNDQLKTLSSQEEQGLAVYEQPLNNSQVLEKVSSYLTELKNQLAQVKGQLISLKTKKFSQEHRLLGSHRPATKEKSSAVFSQRNEDSSVLLDALSLDLVDEDFQRSSSPLLFQHRLPWQQHVSKDDTLISTQRDSPAITFNDLKKDFKNKALLKVETVSTQTEICRTPDREVKPYSRSSQAQTSPRGPQSRNTDTQTDHYGRDEFKSSSFRTADSADVKQAYLVSKHPTLNSAILLPVDEAISPGDSASELSDSFVTAFSSPVNCSPLRSSFRESPDWDPSAEYLGSHRETSGSLTLPKESTETQESSSKNAVSYSDIKIPSVHRKTLETHQEEAQQRMEDMLGTNYARPNIVVEGCQEKADMADCEDEDHNANYDRSGKHSPSTPRKLSPARLKRRSLVEKRTSSLGCDSKMVDLTNNLLDVEMTEEENEFSLKLLEDSKKASDRTKTRRGRRWSPVNSPDQHLQRPSTRDRSPSPTLSPAVSVNDDEVVTDNAVNADDQTSQAEPENHSESPVFVTEPTADTVTEGTTETCPTRELQEERTGGEGESDKEDNKLQSKSERKDSEVEEFDIKADILKATGPIQAEMPQVVKPVLPLAKLREEHKLQRKSNMLFTMPDLTEATESEPHRDSTTLSTTLSTTTSSNPTPLTGLTDPEERLKLVEDSTTDDDKEGCQSNEGPTTDNKALLPDAVLKKLGLKVGHSKELCALTENEIEEKFNALQLAFKANQYTLQKRVTLHHRQRDLAEKNIDGEIEGLLQTLQMLEPLSSIDTVSRDYISKIKQHVEVLQSSSLRLSSKAEGFGAVQQEGRLSKATEVMISHVENLKRLFEREHAELEDAKKLLQENRKMFRGNSITSNVSADGETDSRLLSRRALSVSGGTGKYSVRMRSASASSSLNNSLKNPPDSKTGRRRASVATVVGAGLLSSSYGSPQSRLAGAVRRTSVQLSSSLNTEDFKEAKARLTGSLSTGSSNGRHSPLLRTDSSVVIKRRSSDDGPQVHPLLDGMKAAPLASPSSPPTSPSRRHAVSLPSTPMVSSSAFPKVIDTETSRKELTKVDGAELNSEKKEEVFQKGFEQGLRTQVSQEFSDLREQQKVFCDSLEDLIDQAEEQDKEETNIKQNSLLSSYKILQHLQKIRSRWPRAVHISRLTLTVFVFLLAVTYVIITVIPMEACQGTNSVMYSPWRTLKELLWPYTELRHSNPPPR